MKKIIINTVGAIVIFVIFSFHEFLSWILERNDNYQYFLLPWWAWGIIGVILFEIICIVFFFRTKRHGNNGNESVN
jgi:hypothetical protein